MTHSVITPQGANTMDNIARNGLRYVRDRAKRRDTVGEAAYRTLELVSEGLDVAGRALRQLGEATQPPTRAAKELPAKSAGAKKTTATGPRAKTA
jgi:hypothetical protein